MNHDQKNIDKHTTLIKLFLGKAAPLFLCLFLTVGLFSAFTPDSGELTSFKQHDTPTFSNLDNSSQNSSTDGFAAELLEEDSEEEKETKFHTEYNSNHAYQTLKTAYEGISRNIQVAQFVQQVLNRKTIPLFVLFHSWKSFIS